jgi:hypothetical protein
MTDEGCRSNVSKDDVPDVSSEGGREGEKGVGLEVLVVPQRRDSIGPVSSYIKYLVSREQAKISQVRHDGRLEVGCVAGQAACRPRYSTVQSRKSRISAFDTGIAGQTYLFQPAFLSLRQVLVRIWVPKAHCIQAGKGSGLIMTDITSRVALLVKNDCSVTETG